MIFIAQIALFTIIALLSFVFKIVLHYETALQLFINHYLGNTHD